MTNYNENLQLLQQKAALAAQLEAKHRDLRRQRDMLAFRMKDLQSSHASEQADVDKLEGGSLARYFYQFIGKLDNQLDKERREAAAAKVKLDSAQKELAAIEEELALIQSQMSELGDCQQEYAAVMEQKWAEIKAAGSSADAEILAIRARMAQVNSQKKEIKEAIAAGRVALKTADNVLTELDDADGLNTWDMLGGGGVLLHVAKHSHLDDAQEMVEELQEKLRQFKTELADIDIQGDIKVSVDGFLGFADYFFDGLFADWAVGEHINESRKSVEEVKLKIRAALRNLYELDEKANREAEELRTMTEALLLKQ